MVLASVLKAHTSVDDEWISQRLEMGRNRSVIRLIRQGNDNPEIKRLCSRLLRMLPCEDWYPRPLICPCRKMWEMEYSGRLYLVPLGGPERKVIG